MNFNLFDYKRERGPSVGRLGAVLRSSARVRRGASRRCQPVAAGPQQEDELSLGNLSRARIAVGAHAVSVMIGP